MTVRLANPATLICLTILCAGMALGQQPGDWQPYNAEGFSVLLPELPTTMDVVRPRKMFEKQLTARQFSAYEDRVVYVILAFDNPNGRHPLSRFVDEISKYSTSAKAEEFQQDISGKGFTGKQYGFNHGSGLSGVLRFCMTKDDVYVLEAIGVDVNKPSITRFLDSFAIGNVERDTNPRNVKRQEDTTPNDVIPSRQLTLKARVVVKPEPGYTEEARQNQITGTVVLIGVLASTGRVIDLRAKSSLPHGLTERAMNAARNMRFIPAQKDGRDVSQAIQLEYQFNLY